MAPDCQPVISGSRKRQWLYWFQPLLPGIYFDRSGGDILLAWGIDDEGRRWVGLSPDPGAPHRPPTPSNWVEGGTLCQSHAAIWAALGPQDF